MALAEHDVRRLYGRHAKSYDFVMTLRHLVGFHTCRRHTIELLDPQPGDCVVDLACGTGLNFPDLVKRVGPHGRVIGVDFSPEMLDGARRRIAAGRWTNVDLVEADVTEFEYPPTANGILCTGALGFVAQYDAVIEAAAKALAPDGRLVIRDIKAPQRWPGWLYDLLLLMVRPYGVTEAYVGKRPWEVIDQHFARSLYEEAYFGAIYIAAGIRAA